MNLIIDIGNTAIKIALFHLQTNSPVAIHTFSINQLQECIQKITELEYRKALLCNVNTKELTQIMLNSVKNSIELTPNLKFPFNINYQTPNTLGKDRIANIAGAYSQFPNQNILVIDAGTCLKFDIITHQNNYLGGAISPGFTMRLKALHTFTANLPLLSAESYQYQLMGTNTHTSIIAGCIGGALNEIAKTIDIYQSKYEKLIIILTGGEVHLMQSLADSEKNSIFADPLLTLKGLNTILNANA